MANLDTNGVRVTPGNPTPTRLLGQDSVTTPADTTPEPGRGPLSGGRLVCPHCRHRGLVRRDDSPIWRGAWRCGVCGAEYPELFGVPVLITNVAVRPSYFALPEDLAGEILKRMSLPAEAKLASKLGEIFAYNYALADMHLTAENNYHLNRLQIQGPHSRRPPVRSAVVNSEPAISFENHYLPVKMPAARRVTGNVRLINKGSTLVSSAVAGRPVMLAYHWRDRHGQMVVYDGCRTPLPVEVAPGRAITVPMRFDTPARPGVYRLEVAAVHEHVRWLDDTSLTVPVEVVAGLDWPDAPPGWIVSGQQHADYLADHRAGQAILVEALTAQYTQRDSPAHGTKRPLRVLEVGGCSRPMLVDLPGQLPLEVWVLDIDIQTLQIGHLAWSTLGRALTFVAGDAANPPLVPGSFDAVVMFATLHHFARPVEVLRTLAGLVGPDGLLATLCEPLGHYFVDDTPPDAKLIEELDQGINEQTFTAREYLDIFTQAGLRADRVVMDVGSLKAILRRVTAT